MKTAILLVAYGTSSPQGRGSLRQFDAWVRERFPGISVRWALSSELLRTRLTRARQKNDSVLKALHRLRLENFTHVAVQPLQIIPGSEHTDVRADADEAGRLDGLHVSIGRPLLAGDEDIRAAARAVLAHLPQERRPDEDVVLMGHGSRKQAVTAYAALAGAVRALDARVHVGTMSGALELEALLPRLTSRRVWLMPLLSVVGRHTLEDMAGDAPDSWRSRIEAAGHACAPVVRGTAEYRAFADIWLRHLEDAVAALPTVKKDEEK
ncbi:sirohydrochlorin cobaltochelatase [uncultured Desulfovibrio sp.]|uniref:sirohydrochlorin cobaltochelatase n=1 Tax=uncultured Desulfovibrio sp. TaxID=167968 RepID=UPI00280410B7|nr:sirohydrochlorin cobaltochelatase [uncultured Desulfovibrio sp.]